MGTVIWILVVGGVIWCVAQVLQRRADRAELEKAKKKANGRPLTLPKPITRPAPRATQTASVASATRVASSSSRAPGRWVPLGENVTVCGREVPGGVYVGERLDAVVPRRGTEPALIDPRLPAQASRPDVEGNLMGYWPSYSKLDAASRAAYLDWSAAGRPGGAYIGYVFLFFYGIERQVLVDAGDRRSSAEVRDLLAEVRRLLSLYGDNGSFRGYATDFLSTARLMQGTIALGELTPPRERVGWGVPLEVKLAVGVLAREREPVPADWALAWAATHPEIYPRTPAQRCPEEFADLFVLRYTERHGEGLVVAPGETLLAWDYRPASGSFVGTSISLDAVDLPDVTLRAAPKRMLSALVESVTDELDGFSRYVGRHGDRTSARAVALLPLELASRRTPDAVAKLVEEISADEYDVVATSRLIELVAEPGTPKLAKRDAVAVSRLLASLGLAMEPDVRYGTTNVSQHEQVVLWRDREAAVAPGEGYAAATVLLHLGVAVSASDGEVRESEQAHLESSIETALDLPMAGRRRLRGHLRWLLAERPGNAGLKARTKTMSAAEREQLARYLLAVAAADGHVSPREVDVLKRLYALLGLEAEAIHGDLHALASSEPVPVIPADRDPGDFVIPGPPVSTETTVGLQLDAQRLAEVLASTKDVSQVLTAVFVDEDPVEIPVQPEPEDGVGDGVAGLDAAHSRFVLALAARPEWPRGELVALADAAGLLAAGAIETVNDSAFEVSGALLLEGHDPVELDPHVLKELLDV